MLIPLYLFYSIFLVLFTLCQSQWSMSWAEVHLRPSSAFAASRSIILEEFNQDGMQSMHAIPNVFRREWSTDEQLTLNTTSLWMPTPSVRASALLSPLSGGVNWQLTVGVVFPTRISPHFPRLWSHRMDVGATPFHPSHHSNGGNHHSTGNNPTDTHLWKRTRHSLHPLFPTPLLDGNEWLWTIGPL